MELVIYADMRIMPFGSSSTILTPWRVPHSFLKDNPVPPKNNYLSIFGHLENPTPHFFLIVLWFELYTHCLFKGISN